MGAPSAIAVSSSRKVAGIEQRPLASIVCGMERVTGIVWYYLDSIRTVSHQNDQRQGKNEIFSRNKGLAVFFTLLA
jgi:hypothetical protein